MEELNKQEILKFFLDDKILSNGDLLGIMKQWEVYIKHIAPKSSVNIRKDVNIEAQEIIFLTATRSIFLIGQEVKIVISKIDLMLIKRAFKAIVYRYDGTCNNDKCIEFIYDSWESGLRQYVTDIVDWIKKYAPPIEFPVPPNHMLK